LRPVSVPKAPTAQCRPLPIFRRESCRRFLGSARLPASTWSVVAGDHSELVAAGLFGLVYGVSQIVMGVQLRETGRPVMEKHAA
jgi:hypothetical protein